MLGHETNHSSRKISSVGIFWDLLTNFRVSSMSLPMLASTYISHVPESRLRAKRNMTQSGVDGIKVKKTREESKTDERTNERIAVFMWFCCAYFVLFSSFWVIATKTNTVQPQISFSSHVLKGNKPAALISALTR